jgi:site-specific recombinase XerD
MRQDIYQIDKRIEDEIGRIKNEKGITPKNKKVILEFYRQCVLNNLSKLCLRGYLNKLRRMAVWIKKDFDKADRKDIERVVQTLHDKGFKYLTRTGFKVCIKRFYKWLKGNDLTYPEEVQWIKTTMKRSERTLPGEGDLITEDEISKLIDIADHPRDKAFISCLYESGCRIGELCGLCIKDIAFDKHGALIHVSGKTGSRRIRLISSVSFLSNWINIHPSREDRNRALWVCIAKNFGKPLAYQGVHQLLGRIFFKAGIKKRYNPHLFRHSRATYLAGHLTEFQMNQYFGWVQGSGMASTYVHLSGKNVDSAILELNGIKMNKEESKESNLKPKRCPRCEAVNSFSDRHCSKCGCVLDIKTAIELDEDIKKERKVRSISDKLFNTLMSNKEFQQTLIKKAMELGVGEELIKSIH